jgi:hypothetical protein
MRTSHTPGARFFLVEGGAARVLGGSPRRAAAVSPLVDVLLNAIGDARHRCRQLERLLDLRVPSVVLRCWSDYAQKLSRHLLALGLAPLPKPGASSHACGV